MKTGTNPRPLKNWLDFWALCFSTCFFLSHIPSYMLRFLPFGKAREYLEHHKRTGAGFVGSLSGAMTYMLLPSPIAKSWIVILAAVIFSILVSERAERVTGIKDDSRIVIDEWVGMWIAAWGVDQIIGLPIIFSFVLFRIFDVIKGPWGKSLQKLPGGSGIVLDDVVAGLMANGVYYAIRLIAHL